MQRVDSLEKTLMLGGTGGRRRRGQPRMRWLDGITGREFEGTPGVGDGQGGLACCNSWGRKDLDMTEWLNWTEMNWNFNYWFNFISNDWSVQIFFISSWFSLQRLYASRNLPISSKLFILFTFDYSWQSLITCYISVLSVATSLSFLNLLICALFFS